MLSNKLSSAFNKTFNINKQIPFNFIQSVRTEAYDEDKNILSKLININNESGKFTYSTDGIDYSCIFVKGNTEFLYVIHNCLRCELYDYYNDPHIPRWGYYKILDGSLLAIDDPMYNDFKELKLGWFYGNAKYSYLLKSIDVVKYISHKFNISENKIIYFSSSGGAFASIMAACMHPNTLSISINPQFNIAYWHHYLSRFTSITGINLDSSDTLDRSNVYHHLLNSRSKHVILINDQSTVDYNEQLLPFLSRLGVNQLRYGLNRIGNILLWIIDIPGAPDPHAIAENKVIFNVINYISYKFKTELLFNINKYQNIAIIANEQWHELYELKKRLCTK